MALVLFAGLLAPGPLGAAEEDFSAQILAAHNHERAAVGVPPLAWSELLAAHAAVWARYLAQTDRPGHSPRDQRPGEGENIWLGSTGAFSPEEMVGGWIAEKSNFQNGVFPNVGLSENAQIPGHYTQVIWRGTADLGCALTNDGRRDYLVCRYTPAGNLIGERPY
ncbi:MAG: SCP-like extracellular [Proteobacteria bacterium]|nr:SCP-like extracellular [Pseudomonadota bacterium]